MAIEWQPSCAHHSIAILIIAAVCLVVTPVVAQRGPLQPPLIKEGVTEKISDHVYVIPDGSVPLVPNVAIIVGTKGTLVVDTGLGARNGQAIMREVAKVTKGGDLYLAVTHIHPEHDLGAGGFPAEHEDDSLTRSGRPRSTSPVSRRRSDSRASRRTRRNCSRARSSEKPIRSSTRSRRSISAASRVRLMAMGPNHTRGDIAFWVEPDNDPGLGRHRHDDDAGVLESVLRSSPSGCRA